jgi:hypothetical protein
MRHITPARLDGIEPLLERLRAFPVLTEKQRGTFYRRSRAFLHFHEHGDEVYADVKLDKHEFTRLPATTAAQQRALVARVRDALAAAS